jgi:hypothetical protein
MPSPSLYIPIAPVTIPRWDATQRELRLGDTVVKCFRQCAPNQEAILAAFEEEGWPARIDSPLTNEDNVDALDRLHDTVRRLNQQKVPLIRFLCDGRGEGVIWKLREPEKKKKRPRRAQGAPKKRPRSAP